MKPRVSHQKTAALTLVEVLVIIVVLFGLAALLLPHLAAAKRGGPGPWCVNNLKQIGLSYVIWAVDHNDKYPMQVSVTNGGTLELNNGRNAWINYIVMSNELSIPKVLLCPQDKRHLPPASDFSSQLEGHISYFVGLDAERKGQPQTFLSGDDNFAIGGAPVKSGLLEFSTNTPITWTAERHVYAGSIGLADGSVMQTGSSSLQRMLVETGLATNRLAIP